MRAAQGAFGRARWRAVHGQIRREGGTRHGLSCWSTWSFSFANAKGEHHAPGLEKRCSPFRVEAAPDGAPGWRRDPCRSSGLSHASGGPRGLPRMNGQADARRCTSRRDANHAEEALSGLSCRDIRRSRDMATMWPIQVQVTTANASPREWAGSRTTSRRRLATRAVPVRALTGSISSLPLLRSSRKGVVASVPCTLCRLQPNVLGLTF